MGNFLVSSVCRAHSRSEAVYAIVRAQVKELRGQQHRGPFLQRPCAVQQAVFLRAILSKMAQTAVVMKYWMMAASVRARAALITSLVLISKSFFAGASRQVALPPQDYDDVFDEFNMVYESTPRPAKTLRELQHSAKMEAESLKSICKAQVANLSATPEGGKNNLIKDTDSTEQTSDLDDEYEVLPKPEEDRVFYSDDNPVKSEGARLLQLASKKSDSSMHVEEFVLCGKHDNFEA